MSDESNDKIGRLDINIKIPESLGLVEGLQEYFKIINAEIARGNDIIARYRTALEATGCLAPDRCGGSSCVVCVALAPVESYRIPPHDCLTNEQRSEGATCLWCHPAGKP